MKKINNIEYPIGQLRATIFAPPITYDENNLKVINGILDPHEGFIPKEIKTPHHIPQFFAQQQSIPMEWNMVSESQGIVVSFGPQKIDVVRAKFTETEPTEESFCQYSIDILQKIVKYFSLPITRMAYAPVYTPIFADNFNISYVNNLVYAKKFFEGSSPNNILFNQGYRVKEEIAGSEFLLNYVAEISIGKDLLQDKKEARSITVRNMLNISLDINTCQGKGYKFSSEDMTDFFNNSIIYADKFLKYYMG